MVIFGGGAGFMSMDMLPCSASVSILASRTWDEALTRERIGHGHSRKRDHIGCLHCSSVSGSASQLESKYTEADNADGSEFNCDPE